MKKSVGAMNKSCCLAAVVAFIGISGGNCFAQGWVVLPIREYEALRAQAYPIERGPEAPPVEATLTRVDYDLRVDGTAATGSARLTIDVLKDGWVRVPIPPGLLVREARLGTELVSLIPAQGSGDQLAAILSKKGRSVLALDVAFTVGSAGGEERLSLPVGSSGITAASVAIAQPDIEVKVTGGLAPENTAKPAAKWTTYANGSEPLVFFWHKNKTEEQHVELPPRMRGSLTQLFGLGEDSASVNAEVQIEVLQGAASEVKIAVPDNVTIDQVPGALVADWDVKNGELVVHLLDPVEHSVAFTVAGEMRAAREGKLAIPLLRLLDAERETGGVAVEVLGAGEIKDAKLQGLETTDASQLGQMVASRQSPSLTAFRPLPGAGKRGLEVEVARYTQQAMLTANVEEARYRALITADGKTLVEAKYAVRNNQRDFVKITLPMGAVVWSASVAGKPVHPGEAPDGGMLIPLDKNRAGEEALLFPVEILYLARGDEWSAKGRAALTLPAMDLPVSRTAVVLYYPPLFRVNAEAGAFRMQPYEAPTSEALNGQAAPMQTGLGVVSQNAAQRETQALADRYRNRSGPGRPAASSPVRVSFPAVGPSMFLVSELTGESQGSEIGLSYQKAKDGGAQ
jgi:hypothetical protein